jgi:cytochrome c oxidase cbb3-type subunit 3
MPGHGPTSKPRRTGSLLLLVAVMSLLGLSNLASSAAAGRQEDAKASDTKAPDPAIERGHKLFVDSCGFCHGLDTTGARGPDLVRSSLVAHDVKGDLIGKVVHEGRPDKGMPPLSLTDAQIVDVVAYLHSRVNESIDSSRVPKGYPVAKLLTGNAEAGKVYFNGAGGCKNCHSPTDDLAGIAAKSSPVDLQQHMLYPKTEKATEQTTAVVTLPSGEKIQGKVAHIDDFEIALRDTSGWYHAYPRDQVKVELNDRLAAHRALLDKITQAEMHNLFAYLQTLK